MTRRIVFDPDGWEDYVYWQTQDRKTLKRINQLIADAIRDPFAGIGKPEPLKHVLSGAWSRRIDEKNRLVYYVTDEHIIVLQARDGSGRVRRTHQGNLSGTQFGGVGVLRAI